MRLAALSLLIALTVPAGATLASPESAVAAPAQALPDVDGFPSPMAAPMARMFGVLFVLCAGAGALAWWSRRRRGIGTGNENRIQIIASRGIGPRHNLVLVEVGERRLLLGTGPETVAPLADLSELPPFAAELANALPSERPAEGSLVEVIGTFEGLDA